MHDVLIDSLPVVAPNHPLDPLTPDEIRGAASIVRTAHDLGRGMMFETITLREPDKAVVRDFHARAELPREAFVCAFDRTNGKVYEARVDLRADALVEWRHVPGVRPRILFDDIKLVGEVARADPRFREALAKRGITDIERVQVDPWSAGNYGLPDEVGRRLSHTFCWYRSETNDNGYAHPIEGLCAVIDLDRAEVLRIDDYGVAPVPMANRNYAARYRRAFREGVKPLEVVQPEGPSFAVEGNEVRWQKWRLRIGFTAREGLVLHAVGYEDGGRLRPVLHRAAMSEMVVPYAHPGGELVDARLRLPGRDPLFRRLAERQPRRAVSHRARRLPARGGCRHPLEAHRPVHRRGQRAPIAAAGGVVDLDRGELRLRLVLVLLPGWLDPLRDEGNRHPEHGRTDAGRRAALRLARVTWSLRPLPPAHLQHAFGRGDRWRAQSRGRGRYGGAAGRSREPVRQCLHGSRNRADV